MNSFENMNNYNDYEKKVCELIKTSSNFKEVADKLNVSVGGNTYKEFNKIAKKYGLSIEHFTSCHKTSDTRKQLTPDEIFTKNSTINSSRLSRYIKKFSLKECKCERCKNTEWLGMPIPLQVHHINGDTTDNRLENLQYLCPNCHTFTDNYCGKNTTKKKVHDSYKERRKEEKKDWIQNRINLIHSSNVDFLKWGWVSKIAKICGISTSKVKEFMEKYDYDFYKTCYNKEKAILKVSEEKNNIEQNKQNKLNKIENRKKQIIDTGITTKTYGWQTKLGNILCIKRQSVREFIDTYMPEFYNF